MSKKILIDASSDEETRIALTDKGILDDFEIEQTKKNAVKGDVYLAKITRVEPSLQAAFVDYGNNRHGFLPLTEIHPDYFKIPVSDQQILKKLTSKIQNNEDIDEIKENENGNDQEAEKISSVQTNNKKNYINFFRKYKIQEVIKPRQVILVQINKEERGLKGAALTTFLSFAGRYCVLMPNSLNKDGISRKIADFEERKKLKSILEKINIPEKMSVIIRTAGTGKTKKEINKDLNYLTTQWNKIREKTLKSAAPSMIYEEGSLIKRTIRDLLTNEVSEVIIDGKKGFDIAKKYTKNIIPSQVKDIKLFKKVDKTLFNDNSIEHQINELFSLKVNLPSGGSIVINNTEALIAIDVNSGKNTTERNIENTALNTNLEAAVEIARQLRLRDLGGLVVIDFIDMDDYRNNYKVEKAIKAALYKDRAKVQIGRISMFGLLELSRQRLRSSLIDKSFQKCPYCIGSGIILNSISICEQILKVVNEKLVNNKNINIEVKCNTALSDILLNSKRAEIHSLEKTYNSKIRFILDDHFSLHEPIITSSEKIKDLSQSDEKTKKNIKKKKSTRKKDTVKNKEKIITKPSKIKTKTILKYEKKKKNIQVNKKTTKKISENLDSANKVNQKSGKKISENLDSANKVNQKSGWWTE